MISADVLPNSRWSFDESFDVKIFLHARDSFLSRLSHDGVMFGDFLNRVSKEVGVDARILLVLLEMTCGLVSRTKNPEDKKLFRCLSISESDSFGINGIKNQVVAAARNLQSLYLEGLYNFKLPLKDGALEVYAKNAASYAVVTFLWEIKIKEFDRFRILYHRWFK